MASALDCESRLTLANPARVKRVYGNYFGVTFYIDGRTDFPVALLWAQDDGYWKIVSWRVGAKDCHRSGSGTGCGGETRAHEGRFDAGPRRA